MEGTASVVIEWDVPSVSVARFATVENQLQIIQQFSIRIPSDVTSSDVQAGGWLRQQLIQNGIAATSAMLVIPRRYISTRLIEIPTDDRNEIAAICRLQLKASSSGEEARVVGDYLLGPSIKAGSSHVFLATMCWDQLDSMKTTLAAAGLAVQGILVAEFLLSKTHANSSSGLTMQVWARERRIEFVVCSQGFPLAAQTFPFLDEGVEVASVMPALGSRVLQSVPPSFRKTGLASVDLYGADAGKLATHFQQYFDVPVHFSDSTREPGLSLLAVARVKARDGSVIDFASPKVDSFGRHSAPRRKLGAVLAVVFCALIMSIAALYNVRLDSEYTELRRLTEQTAKANRTQQSVIDAHQFLSAWEQSRIHLPTQIVALAEHLPAKDRAYLKSLHVDVSQSSATIKAKGHAQAAADVVAVHDRLVDDPRFVLHPQAILPRSSDDYKVDFSILVTIKSP